MSDQIKHECGIALIRLLKPLDFYYEKYGTAFYGLNKLQILMQKQRNRGQDGAGIATIKLDPPGHRYISRKRSNRSNAIKDIFEQVFWHFAPLSTEEIENPQYLKAKFPYMGELMMGHLRYGTHGGNDIETVHPFLRQSNWQSRNLVIAGNFNMTNVDELFNHLVKLGQHPKEKSDTVTVMERIGHFLDDEVHRLFQYHKPDHTNSEISEIIAQELKVERVLTRAAKKLDGGYVMVGMIGHGDAFVMRDPNGIRPAFYFQNDEIVVAASERPAIQTVMNVPFEEIRELKPAHALIIKKDGRVSEKNIFETPQPRASCSFERIYFSRGTDREIYAERKKLGELLAQKVLESVNFDFKNTVFSFIPNTAEVAFYGLVEGANHLARAQQRQQILELSQNASAQNGSAKGFEKRLDEIMQSNQVRVEKIVVKDEKQRTFITQDEARGDMVASGYDITYGTIQKNVDTMVLLDDSIVRGTTLKNSIIKIVARLQPRKIVIVSSSPQIRFPDCYGIDMSKIGDFVAFRAARLLLEERNMEHLLEETYQACKAADELPIEEVENHVKKIYAPFSDDEISAKIAQIVKPEKLGDIELEVIYQTIPNLHRACPEHTGDWYFSGNYPTPGGNRVANRAFINFMEKKNVRAY